MGLALLACDSIIEDKFTGKKSLIGLCGKLFSAQFPCVHPELSIFVSLTGGIGEYSCELIGLHDDQQTKLFTAEGKLKFSDPRQIIELVFHMRSIRIPKAGIFGLQFLVNGVPIMLRPLHVEMMKRPDNPPSEKK